MKYCAAQRFIRMPQNQRTQWTQSKKKTAKYIETAHYYHHEKLGSLKLHGLWNNNIKIHVLPVYFPTWSYYHCVPAADKLEWVFLSIPSQFIVDTEIYGALRNLFFASGFTWNVKLRFFFFFHSVCKMIRKLQEFGEKNKNKGICLSNLSVN